MTWRSPLIVCFLCMCSAAAALAKAPPPALSSALPSSAVRGPYAGIHGDPGAYVLTFDLSGWHAGLIDDRGGKYVLEWERKLSGKPILVDSPEQDVFRVVTRLANGKGEALYADEIHGISVISGLQGHAGGRVTSAEPIAFKSHGFELKSPAAHTGSIRYRLAQVYAWEAGVYALSTTFLEPDYARADYPRPSGWVKTQKGDTALTRLEIADTEPKRQTGLMFRTTLDPDSGMIFVWPGLAQDSFWMENTRIPLSIAWLAADGTVQEIQDMQPNTTDLHAPALPYHYALEVNLGYFATWGIKVGDRFHLLLSP